MKIIRKKILPEYFEAVKARKKISSSVRMMMTHRKAIYLYLQNSSPTKDILDGS